MLEENLPEQPGTLQETSHNKTQQAIPQHEEETPNSAQLRFEELLKKALSSSDKSIEETLLIDNPQFGLLKEVINIRMKPRSGLPHIWTRLETPSGISLQHVASFDQEQIEPFGDIIEASVSAPTSSMPFKQHLTWRKFLDSSLTLSVLQATANVLQKPILHSSGIPKYDDL